MHRSIANIIKSRHIVSLRRSCVTICRPSAFKTNEYGLKEKIFKPIYAVMDLAFIDMNPKGSRKNNFTFWHLIFKSFLVHFKNQKP